MISVVIRWLLCNRQWCTVFNVFFLLATSSIYKYICLSIKNQYMYIFLSVALLYIKQKSGSPTKFVGTFFVLFFTTYFNANNCNSQPHLHYLFLFTKSKSKTAMDFFFFLFYYGFAVSCRKFLSTFPSTFLAS